MRVTKRDGQVQQFSNNKIERAAVMAIIHAGYEWPAPTVLGYARAVRGCVERKLGGADLVGVEAIQDEVIRCLAAEGLPLAADAFRSHREARAAARQLALTPDPNAVADYTHAAKYAWYLHGPGRLEMYSETIDRVEDMHVRRWPGHAAAIRSMFRPVREKRVLPSMRSMQFAGKAVELNNTRMYNCLAKETRIVTDCGVMSLEEIGDGGSCSLLTHRGRFRNAVVRRYGTEQLYRVRLARGRGVIEVEATKSHRWIKVDGGVTQSLNVGDRVLVAPNTRAFDLNEADDAELKRWCMGFAYGDGTKTSDGWLFVRLCGRKSEYAWAFEKAGFNVTHPPSYGGDACARLGKMDKRLPDGPDEAFLAGWVAADGSNGNHLSTSCPESRAWVYRNAPACGWHVTGETVFDGPTNYGERSSPLSIIRFMTHSDSVIFNGWTVKSIDPVRVDDVWCAEVEDDASFVIEGGVVTGNCSFSHCNRIRFFGELMYLLLSGCGAGYSVQFRHVEQLPRIKFAAKVKHHTVGDSIEGWADAVTALFVGYMATGEYVEFDYSEVRSAGSPIVTSGGVAPGHEPLRDSLEACRAILKSAQGRKLRPIECHDCCCHLALAVLSGGIRRASLISLFSVEDSEMLYCKAHGNFVPAGTPGKLPKNDQRQMANNSAVLLRPNVGAPGATREQYDRVMDASRDWGDPGFFFTHDLDWGTNPCGEIGLDPVLTADRVPDTTWKFDWRSGWHAPLFDKHDHDLVAQYGSNVGWQFCNLCEVNVAAASTKAEFLAACESAAAIGTMQAAYTSFRYLGPVTERLARRDALLGVGLTGVVDNPAIGLDPATLREGVEAVRRANAAWADMLGIRRATRLTTVKPSGTASLELGCVGSGCHPHHAKRYFRRVTANPREEAAKHFRAANPHMVEEKPNGDWSICFPVQAPGDGPFVKDLGAVEHIRRVMTLYENWVLPGSGQGFLTHNVSSTTVCDDAEWPAVKDYVWEHRERIAAMSFLGRFSDKSWPFAPREEVVGPVDEAKWRSIIGGYVPVDWAAMRTTDPVAGRTSMEPACVGGACEV